MSLMIPNLRKQKRQRETIGERKDPVTENVVPDNGYGLRFPFVAEDPALLAATPGALMLADLQAYAAAAAHEGPTVQRIGGAKKKRQNDDEHDGDEDDDEAGRNTRWSTCGLVLERDGHSMILASGWNSLRVRLDLMPGPAQSWRSPEYAVVRVCNAEVTTLRGQPLIRVYNLNSLTIVGVSHSIGRCAQIGCEALVPRAPGRRCLQHEEDAYHRQWSSRMELNSGQGRVPVAARLQGPSAPAPARSVKQGARVKKSRMRSNVGTSEGTKEIEAKVEASLEHQAKKLLATQGGLGAKSLAALVESEGPRMETPLITASTLKTVRAGGGGPVSSHGGILHPNSWHLHAAVSSAVVLAKGADEEFVDLIDSEEEMN